MDRGAQRAAVHGSQRARHDWATNTSTLKREKKMQMLVSTYVQQRKEESCCFMILLSGYCLQGGLSVLQILAWGGCEHVLDFLHLFLMSMESYRWASLIINWASEIKALVQEGPGIPEPLFQPHPPRSGPKTYTHRGQQWELLPFIRAGALIPNPKMDLEPCWALLPVRTPLGQTRKAEVAFFPLNLTPVFT